MDWKNRLIALFDDPLLADVRPLAPRITADDRLAKSFLEICDWIEERRMEPRENSDDIYERRLYRRLKGFRENEEKRNYLKSIDRLMIL